MSRCEVSLEDQVNSEKPFKAEFRCVVMTHAQGDWLDERAAPQPATEQKSTVGCFFFIHTGWLLDLLVLCLMRVPPVCYFGEAKVSEEHLVEVSWQLKIITFPV